MWRFFMNIVAAVNGCMRLSLLKLVHGSNVTFGKLERVSLSAEIGVEKGSQLRLGENCCIRSGCKVKVLDKGKIEMGRDVFLNYGCMLMCRSNIVIGEGCEFGPNVLVYDHDHDVRAEGGLKANAYTRAPIHIGKNCWIGANTVILKGACIGEGSVVGAGSVITHDIPANTIAIQKRECTEYRINAEKVD